MRLIIRFPALPLLLALLAPFSHADDMGLYNIGASLFDDYRPAHQRPNPGADWERTKAREQARIDREFERTRNRAGSDGRIDRRDYGRSSWKNDERIHYHSPDSNRHRHSGRIDSNTYGATPFRAPASQPAPRRAGPDNAARQENAMPSLPSAPRKNPYPINRLAEKPGKYYGTRSGESLYPYTAKPVKGAWNAEAAAPARNGTASRQAARAAYEAAKPRDPSYGGNTAWGVSREARVDTRRFYQDEIARYRKEHRPQAYCTDGSISGRGTGACSRHGGLLKRS